MPRSSPSIDGDDNAEMDKSLEQSVLEAGIRGQATTSKSVASDPATGEHQIRNSIRRLIHEYGWDHGLSTSEVKETLKISRATATRHLDILCRLREVYRVRRGPNQVLYYPNGRPLHDVEARRMEFVRGGGLLDVHVAQGMHDRMFFHVLERRVSLLEGEQTEGAITIPLEQLEEFVQILRSLATEVQDG